MIIFAAILLDEHGMVLSGKRHDEMRAKYYKEYKETIGGEDGFMTDEFKFLNRTEALKHAIGCGQIPKSDAKQLFSEDIW